MVAKVELAASFNCITATAVNACVTGPMFHIVLVDASSSRSRLVFP
jgi:hypothetical protein